MQYVKMLLDAVNHERGALNAELMKIPKSTTLTTSSLAEQLRSKLYEVEVRASVLEMFIAYLTLTSEGCLLHGTVLGFAIASVALQ